MFYKEKKVPEHLDLLFSYYKVKKEKIVRGLNMGIINIGDIVARKSYKSDILFKVEKIIVGESNEKMALLRGMEVRLYADAPLWDLEKKNSGEIMAYKQNFLKKNSDMVRQIFKRRLVDKERILERGKSKKVPLAESFELPGRVLHIDGDKEYLDLCMATYAQLNINAQGFYVPESEQPQAVAKYLPKYIPDILVITGHDGLIGKRVDFKDVRSYRHSKFFIQAVRKAREFEPGRDDLIIFAGACQSHYEALLKAGANFASSPRRIMIHAYDPVFIVEKLAWSSIYDIISVKDIVDSTITGIEGVGGIDTRGRLRMGYPKSPY